MRGRLREWEVDTDTESFEARVTPLSGFSWTERYRKKDYLRVAQRYFGEEKEICVQTFAGAERQRSAGTGDLRNADGARWQLTDGRCVRRLFGSRSVSTHLGRALVKSRPRPISALPGATIQ